MSAQPASAYEPLLLLSVIRDVADGSGGADPQGISQRDWDAARAGPHASAPSARRITEYLGLPWVKVRELAFMNEPARARALGRALGEKEQDWLTPEYTSFVLQIVARRLGRSTLTPSVYMQERKTLLAEDASHWLHGRKLLLPTDEQIRSAAGSWDTATRSAGLEDSKPGGGYAKKPPSIVEILDRCYEAHGTEPTTNESEVFARANGIPYPRREIGRAWSSYLIEWKEGRRNRGLGVPDKPPSKNQRPDYTINVGAGLHDEKRMRLREDFDEAVDCVVRYLNQLDRLERATLRGYNAWATTQDGALYASNFQRNHGGWANVRDAAWEKLRRGSGG